MKRKQTDRICIYGLFFLLSFSLSSCTAGMSFDAKVWRESGSWEQESFPRIAMAKDLITHHTLQGKPKAEVFEMLGEPNSIRQYDSGQELMYWLGPSSGFGIDSTWLWVKVDEGERVKECDLYED